jgi:stage II sporulation protein AA (anti-sigma F factor antagonist)
MNVFRHTATDRGDHVLLALAGDLDLAAYATLLAQLKTLIGVGHAVVVDCSEVSFMDSMGLKALVEGVHAAGDAGLGFELTAVPDPVLRVLELSGTTELFTVREPAPEESGA